VLPVTGGDNGAVSPDVDHLREVDRLRLHPRRVRPMPLKSGAADGRLDVADDHLNVMLLITEWVGRATGAGGLRFTTTAAMDLTTQVVLTDGHGRGGRGRLAHRTGPRRARHVVPGQRPGRIATASSVAPPPSNPTRRLTRAGSLLGKGNDGSSVASAMTARDAAGSHPATSPAWPSRSVRAVADGRASLRRSPTPRGPACCSTSPHRWPRTWTNYVDDLALPKATGR
jgi:hypothetical protein